MVPGRCHPRLLASVGGGAAILCGCVALLIYLTRLPAARCDAAYRENRWADARTACQEVAAGDPPRALKAALTLLRFNDWRAALDELRALFDSEVGANARRGAAYVLAYTGELDEAERLLHTAQVLHLAAGELGELAGDHHQLIGALLVRRRFDDAKRQAEAGLGVARAADDPRMIVLLELALAEIAMTIGDAASARDAFARATAERRAPPSERASLALKHGMFALDYGEAATASEILETARALAEQLGDQRTALAAHLNLAEALRLAGRLADAERHLAAARIPDDDPEAGSAIRIAGMIAAARGDARADALLARASEMTDDDDYRWDIAVERGRLAELRGDRARAEQLYGVGVAIVEELRADTSAIELRPWVLAHRRAPYEALFALRAQGGRAIDALAVAAMLHARSLLDAIRGRGLPGAPPSGADALAALGARDALIFVRARGVLWRLVVTGRAIEPPIALGALDRELRDWARAPGDDRLAARLGAALIPHDLARATDQPLYLIAGAELAGVPIAMLRPAGERLIAQRPLVIVPGFGVLDSRARSQPADQPPVFIGDVDGSLPAARAEVVQLAERAGVTAIVGAAATSARVLGSGRARLLHLAVHASAGANASLELADGALTSAQIAAAFTQGDEFSRRLATRPAEPSDSPHRASRRANASPAVPPLVVLAGCATSASADPEAWRAVASAFLAAGACTVIATQRSIHDGEAAALLERFYALGGDREPAAALAAAQAERADQPIGTWAYFAAYGAARPDDCAARR